MSDIDRELAASGVLYDFEAVPPEIRRLVIELPADSTPRTAMTAASG